jgi:hypothetical protein
MIAARKRKAQRLRDVQQDLQRLEEMRLAGLKGRQSDIAVMREELAATLNGDETLREIALPMIVKRLKLLGEESVRVDNEIERRSQLLRTLAGRTKQADRLLRALEQRHERIMSDKELLDMIERALRSDDASLP